MTDEGDGRDRYLPLALFDEGDRTLGHELGKVLAGGLHRLGPLVQVMKARTVKKVVVVVVDESAEVSEMVVEALSQGTVSFLGSQMPFSKNGCFIILGLK